MDEIPTSDLNRKLASILERVANGESFYLTRYGKRVAAVGPPNMTIRKGPPRPVEPIIIEEEPRPWTANEQQRARDDLLNRINRKKE